MRSVSSSSSALFSPPAYTTASAVWASAIASAKPEVSSESIAQPGAKVSVARPPSSASIAVRSEIHTDGVPWYVCAWIETSSAEGPIRAIVYEAVGSAAATFPVSAPRALSVRALLPNMGARVGGPIGSVPGV